MLVYITQTWNHWQRLRYWHILSYSYCYTYQNCDHFFLYLNHFFFIKKGRFERWHKNSFALHSIYILYIYLLSFSPTDIDQSLSGNYTCLAKNLYGSDSVEYTVVVLPLPEAPVLRATPYKDSILVEWEQPYYSISNRSSSQKISKCLILSYYLNWEEKSPSKNMSE